MREPGTKKRTAARYALRTRFYLIPIERADCRAHSQQRLAGYAVAAYHYNVSYFNPVLPLERRVTHCGIVLARSRVTLPQSQYTPWRRPVGAFLELSTYSTRAPSDWSDTLHTGVVPDDHAYSENHTTRQIQLRRDGFD